MRTVTITVCLSVFLAAANSALAAEPAEVKNLDRRVGTWKTVTTLKKAAWTPKEVTITGEETIKWILDRKFLQGDAVDQNGVKNHWLMNYDAESKLYRFWHFDSTGNFPRGDAIGMRKGPDDLSWTMDWGNGIRSTSSWKMTGKDKLDWELIARDKAGTIVMHMVATCTRKKKK
jgi:hypothetical protein